MSTPTIIGRHSSHYTRVTLIFAHEFGVDYEFQPIFKMDSTDPGDYGGHPGLRLPSICLSDRTVFGSLNVCRVLSELAQKPLIVLWPEDIRGDLAVNTQELVLQAMATQVSVVFCEQIAELPTDNLLRRKSRMSLESMVRWLDENLAGALRSLPDRDLSFLETNLFCLLEHFGFRKTGVLGNYPQLNEFALEFSERPSAQLTEFRYDTAS